MMENEEQSTSPSLKEKLRKTLCLSCCLPTNHPRRKTLGSPPSPSSEDRPRLLRASSMWIRLRAHDLPEIKHKCRHLISRIGRYHRRHFSSVDFQYDPLSYAHNFDDSFEDGHLDGEVPLRDFFARVPASPPQLATVPEADDLPKSIAPTEITCV